MKDQHPLDDLIRQRIDALPPPPPPAGPAGIARRAPAATTGGEGGAGKRRSLPPPVAPPGCGGGREEKLVASEALATKAVDTAVASRLQQAAPAVPSGWALLAARLELIGKRREMVASVKIAEVALLLSLLLIAFRFGPAALLPTETPLADESSTKLSGFPVATRPPAERATATTDTPSPSLHEPTGSEQAADNNRAIGKLATLPTGGQIPPLVTGTPNTIRLRRRVAVSETVATIDYTVSWGEPPLQAPPYLAPPVAAQPIHYYANLFASPVDVNQVVTPHNQYIGIAERQSNFSTGYSIGALVDIVQGNNGVQTGLQFSYRSYVPVAFGLIQGKQPLKDGEEPVRFGRLRYRTISIPLIYNRQLYQDQKWRVSGGLGVAMNVILSSDFKLDNNLTLDDLDRFWREYLARGKEEGTIANIGRSSEYTDLLAPPQGYLEGGSLIKNTSLYVTGSLRFERLLDDRWSLYFSPTVMRQFTVREDDGGKGPLQDRIHSGMFRFGTRLLLSDK